LKKYQASIKKKISIDREVSRRYWRQKDLDRSRRYWVSIEQTETPKNWLDGSGYLSRGIENKPRNLDRKRHVSRSYWGGVELPLIGLKGSFQGGEAAQE